MSYGKVGILCGVAICVDEEEVILVLGRNGIGKVGQLAAVLTNLDGRAKRFWAGGLATL